MSVSSTYNKRAKHYDDDADTQFLFHTEKRYVLDILKLTSTDKVLDIGCGTGKYIAFIKKKNKNITCSDISSKMLDIVSEKHKNITCIQSNLTKKLPFKNNSFNKILCTQVLKHVESLEKTFKEMQRILKPQGSFVFTVIHPDANWEGYKLKNKTTKDNTPNDSCYITKHTLTHILGAIDESKLHISSIKQCFPSSTATSMLTKNSRKKISGRALILAVEVKKK